MTNETVTGASRFPGLGVLPVSAGSAVRKSQGELYKALRQLHTNPSSLTPSSHLVMPRPCCPWEATVTKQEQALHLGEHSQRMPSRGPRPLFLLTEAPCPTQAAKQPSPTRAPKLI